MEEKGIALIAMVISILAALVSIWQAMIARKTLKLTIDQSNLSNPKFEIFIITTAQTKSKDYIHYIIDCSILNKSRAEESILSASLIVQYKNEKSIMMNFKCEHSEINKEVIGLNTSDVSKLPLHLNANDTSNCTFIFEIKNEIFKNCSIMDYYFEVISISGIRISKNIPIIPFLDK